jgi:predicted Rossmann-fold nucleotide-binding protein
VRHFPVVLFGSEFWAPLLEWVNDTLLPQHLISASDLELLSVTDSPEEALARVLDCYEPQEAGMADAQ